MSITLKEAQLLVPSHFPGCNFEITIARTTMNILRNVIVILEKPTECYFFFPLAIVFCNIFTFLIFPTLNLPESEFKTYFSLHQVFYSLVNRDHFSHLVLLFLFSCLLPIT